MTATLDVSQALGHLPQSLRTELIAEYSKIAKNYTRHHWQATELNGGRFCEVAYSILKGYIDGTYPTMASKPRNFPKACEELGQADKTKFPQSVRIGIPRVLIGLYEIRNNRGVGHVGGDVDANHMDATFVLHAVQWVMAELVRIFHDTDVETATKTVEALVERTLPLIWEVNGRRRVLNPSMRLADKTLLLLYAATGGMSDIDLATNLKHRRIRDYKKVLRSLDDNVLVEYDQADGHVQISPSGEADVEARLLPSITFEYI
ncbi:hypothetical protein [Amycolatopsis kentuckyensis]|uniref:hypothetical protein n=1 Tax=Amycolatopsis kentuckyensis TaxID=218823 RepID=UPI003563E7ED